MRLVLRAFGVPVVAVPGVTDIIAAIIAALDTAISCDDALAARLSSHARRRLSWPACSVATAVPDHAQPLSCICPNVFGDPRLAKRTHALEPSDSARVASASFPLCRPSHFRPDSRQWTSRAACVYTLSEALLPHRLSF